MAIYSRDNDTWLNLNHVIKAERVSRAAKFDILEEALLRKLDGI